MARVTKPSTRGMLEITFAEWVALLWAPNAAAPDDADLEAVRVALDKNGYHGLPLRIRSPHDARGMLLLEISETDSAGVDPDDYFRVGPQLSEAIDEYLRERRGTPD